MAGENVVSIVVKASDQTKAGFDEAKASAGEAGAGMDEYAVAVERVTKAEIALRDAQIAETDAQMHLAEVQASDGGASADVLAAAQDKVTAATLRSLDAQRSLVAAEAQVAAAEHGAAGAAEEQGVKADASGGLMAGAGGKMKMAALGVAVGLGLAVKGAADFQQQTVKLTTSAGESAKNLGMVQQGILAMSSATNTSTEELAKGMYTVESAGFHGAQGLLVLKAAAEGAQAEGADMGEVANAVTSGLNAYGMSANHATAFTNQMVTAVGQGKMTMQDLAGSLSAVLPIAASAHISFAQIGGAIATMTAQGMSARQASQDLANIIRSLISPSATASAEMKALGLNANNVSRNIGKNGLTGTLQVLTEAVLRNTSGGNVLLGYMKEMTPAAQGVARAILAGTITTKELRTATQALNPEQAKLVSLFQTSATSATGLKQTFAGAMKEMTGGATGLNVALMLGGSHMKTFQANVKAVGDAAQGAGKDVNGWKEIQGEANFQIGAAEKAVKAMGDSLGLALLPAVTAVLHPLTSFFELIASNKAASIAFATVVGGLLAGALGMKLAGAFKDVKAGIEGFAGLLEALIPKLMGTAAAEEAAAEAGTEMDAAMDANPIGLIVLAIAALVVGIIELVKHWGAVEHAAKAAWGGIEEGAKAAFGVLKSVWNAVYSTILAPVVRAFDAVKGFIVSAFDGWWKSHGTEIKEVWHALWTGITDFFKIQWDITVAVAKTSWAIISGIFKMAWDVITTIVRTSWAMTMAVLRPGLDALTTIFRTAWDAISAVFKAAWDLIAGTVKVALAAITALIKVSWDIAVGVFDVFLDLITGHWGKAWKDIQNTVTQVMNAVKGFLSSAWDDIKGAAIGAWNALFGGVKSVISNLLGFVERLPGEIMNSISALPGMMFRAGIHVIDSLINGMVSMAGKLGSFVGGLAGKVAGFFGLSPAKEGPLSGAGAPEIRGAHFTEALAAGMLSGRGAVQAAAQHLAGAAALTPGGGGYGGGAGGAAGQVAVQFQLGSGGSGIDQLFMTWLKNAIRTGGGDPRILTKKVAFL